MTEPDWAPEACTLPSAERPLRLAEFDALFATATRAGERLSPHHLRLTLAADAAAVRDLAARENRCCSFFTFTVTELPADRVRLDVEVPAAQVAVLDALAARGGA